MCRRLPGCPLSSHCTFSHNEYEVKFFPTNYQSQVCKENSRLQCLNGAMCLDAHTGKNKNLLYIVLN